jgi:hypothetical protein
MGDNAALSRFALLERRSACIVPHCKNSSAKYAGCDYICGPHWRLVPKRLKQRDRLIIKRLIAQGEAVKRDGFLYPLTARAYRLSRMSWRRMNTAALQSATGC